MYVPHCWMAHITRVRFSHSKSGQFWHGPLYFTTGFGLFVGFVLFCVFKLLLLIFFKFVSVHRGMPLDIIFIIIVVETLNYTHIMSMIV